jgi:DnaJ-class molecular chaperone
MLQKKGEFRRVLTSFGELRQVRSKIGELHPLVILDNMAGNVQVRRAYRNLVTKEHPDKGGNAEKFAQIQRAYEVLSSDSKREQYDTTGLVEKTADEELLDTFGGGEHSFFHIQNESKDCPCSFQVDG